jgi:hypothetical protein
MAVDAHADPRASHASARALSAPPGHPVVGRDDESQPADLAERLQVVVWEGALAIDAGGLWCDALLGGLTDRVEDASNVGHEDPFDR